MISFYSLQCFDNSEIAELFSPQNTEIDVLARTDLIEWLRQLSAPCDETEAIQNYVQRNFENLFLELSGAQELRAANAGELIVHYLQYGDISCTVEGILSESMQVLYPSLCPVNATVANTLKRIFEICMSADYRRTTRKIAELMTADLMEGVIQNISLSSTIGETIIVLFGARMMFSEILQPGFPVKSFTAAWIKFNFHKLLIKNYVDALTTPEKYRLIDFVRELCSLGYSPTVGPLVDLLLDKEHFSTMLSATLNGCIKTIEGRNDANAPVPEAIAIFTSILRLARQTFPASNLISQYNFNIQSYPSVLTICDELPRFVRILQHETPKALTRIKGAICLLFKELILFQMKYVDIQVQNSGFFSAFLTLCELFPNNNSIGQILNEFCGTIFSRTAIHEKCNDVLLMYFTEGPGSQYIRQVCDFVTNESYCYCAVRSHSHAVLRLLMNSALFQEKEGALTRIIDSRTEAKVMELNSLLDTQLTGEGFTEAGSAQVPLPSRESCINFCGVQEQEPSSPIDSPIINEANQLPLKELPPPTGDGYESLQTETFLLRDSSSAQVQAYPSFRNVQLLFASTSE